MPRTDPVQPYLFSVTGVWSAEARSGRVDLGQGQAAVIATPPQFGGVVPGTSPEELLLGGAAACYLMTLGRICAREGLDVGRVEARAEGEVSRTAEGLHFDRIRMRPTFRVKAGDEALRERLLTAAREAAEACFIARTLRAAIPYELEPVFAAG